MDGKGHQRDLRPEVVRERDLPICDAHHHLWEYAGNVYLGKDLLEDIDGHNVVQTVVVEAWGWNTRRRGNMQEPAEETALAVAESNRNPGRTKIAAGIVGHADLMMGEAVEEVIESHIIAGQGRFCGVRPGPGSVLTDTRFLEGCSVVNKHQLAIDVVVRNQHLPELVALATKYPETPIIINHLGLLPRRHLNQPSLGETSAYVASWKAFIADIATYQNVYMKLGGLGMDLGSAGWEESTNPDSTELAQLMKPWYSHCIEEFGAERCMLESNFPVDKKSFSYNVHWNAAKRLTKNLSPAERHALFYATALRAYRL